MTPDPRAWWAWWPAASPEGWALAPALYPAAVLLSLLPALLILAVARRRGVPILQRQWLLLSGGTLVLVAALCWPLGEVAQITLTGRTVQYLLLTFAGPPLVLLGAPRWRAAGRGRLRRVLERIAGAPWIGAIVLALTTWLTHLPAAIDGVEATAEGAAAVRCAWLAASFLYWWPLVGPGPARERLSYFAGVGYLVLPFVFPKLPAVTWVFATDLLHERLADGPGVDVWGLSPIADQGLAAFILWLPGSVMVAVSIYILFRHWFREDRRLVAHERLGLPADPDAVAALMAGPLAAERWAALEALVPIVDEAAPPGLGTDLTVNVRAHRVVLVLRVPDRSEAEQDALARRIEAGYTVHLRRHSSATAAAIRDGLAVEVQGYGARVR